MSKRFGRRQKRKLKEQLAISNDLSKRSADSYCRLLSRFSDWQERVSDVLGKDNALNPKIRTIVSSIPRNRDVLSQMPTSPLEYTSSVAQDIYVRIAQMDRFTCVVDELPSEYNYMIRLKEKEGFVGETYYSVSKDVFSRIGLDKEAVDHFSHQIAERLVELINRSRRS